MRGDQAQLTRRRSPRSVVRRAEEHLRTVLPRSSVKNSASDIGMPSSTFLSELTEGLTRFCSISEIIPLVTPARLASSRWDSPYMVRTARRCAPTSMSMGV